MYSVIQNLEPGPAVPYTLTAGSKLRC